MSARNIGILLIAVGLVLDNYGFLHDLIWAKHQGAIYMGIRTYAVVVLGIVLTVGGVLLVWRSPQR